MIGILMDFVQSISNVALHEFVHSHYDCGGSLGFGLPEMFVPEEELTV